MIPTRIASPNSAVLLSSDMVEEADVLDFTARGPFGSVTGGDLILGNYRVYLLWQVYRTIILYFMDIIENNLLIK